MYLCNNTMFFYATKQRTAFLLRRFLVSEHILVIILHSSMHRSSKGCTGAAHQKFSEPEPKNKSSVNFGYKRFRYKEFLLMRDYAKGPK